MMRTTHGLRRAFLLCIVAAVPCVATASADVARQVCVEERLLLVNLAELRSAYLQREGLVQYDQSDTTPDGIRRQLQRHFDAVLRLLGAATPVSIETALDRLELARAENWSESERAGWRQQLMYSRLVQLVRLKAYRDRGVFPLNEGHADLPVPIFVDLHDTACAVGHLMRLSGWEDAVMEIRATNDLVYVPDVEHGALMQWTLESGLTLEEAGWA